MESHFRNVCGVAEINTSIDYWPQSASVAKSEPYCTADMCSVNINGRESPLYLRAGTYEAILGGYSTLKNYHMTFLHTPVCFH